MTMKILSSLILVLISMFARAQQGGVGTWIDYLPYGEVHTVVKQGNKLYGATPFALVEIDLRDNAASRLSRVTGLSGTNVTALAASEVLNLVVVGYASGSLDIIEGNRIRTYNDIQRSSGFPERGIQNIQIVGTEAYISTQFGIVKYNLDRREVRDTYLLGSGGNPLQINSTTILNDTLYAATESGLLAADVNNPLLRISDSWRRMTEIPMPDSAYHDVVAFNNQLIINKRSSNFKRDSLMVRTETGWETPAGFGNWNFFSLKPMGDTLAVARNEDVIFLSTDFEEEFNLFTYETSELPQPRDVIKGDNPEEFWIADYNQGVIRNERIWVNDRFLLQSPQSSRARRFDFAHGKTYVASGGLSIRQVPQFTRDGFYIQNNNTAVWKNYSFRNYPEIEMFFDFVDIAADRRSSDRFYTASYSNGILVWENDELVEVYNNTNSPLGGEDRSNDEPDIQVSSITVDDDNNLWATVTNVPHALAVKTEDGDFYSYNFAGLVDFGDRVGDVLITSNGHKWVNLIDKGILVFDDNGTLDDIDDDRARILNAQEGSGNLPSTGVLCMAEDNSGRIWVGTDQGVAVFFSPSNVLESNADVDAQQIFVQVDGFTQYLMENEAVTAIAVDGADRKWFTTEGSGVFLMSADGTQQIFHFTEDNSELLSDIVVALDVNPFNGEVMIATESGLVAFKGTATAPDALMQDVYAYPNPVHPYFTGNIAIKGLARGARVKITDINGNLVFDTRAEGGQAIWNGQGPNGDRVPTGIYLVFAADQQGVESVATKIMFVN